MPQATSPSTANSGAFSISNHNEGSGQIPIQELRCDD
jgi:hypothetical protein